jgi:hypothetical protein
MKRRFWGGKPSAYQGGCIFIGFTARYSGRGKRQDLAAAKEVASGGIHFTSQAEIIGKLIETGFSSKKETV